MSNVPGADWSTGPWDSVPCPNDHCRKANNFRDHRELLFDQWTGIGAAKDKLVFECDHCHSKMEVVRVVQTVHVSVRPA